MDSYTTSFQRGWVLLLLTATVYSQENFTRFTGQDVLLPCFYSGHGKPLGDVEVFWRTKDDRDVYSILKAQTDLSGQDLQFRDRTSAFPEAYGEGNFSILLKNVDVSDTGRYDCFMPTVASGALSQVELTVREKPVEPAVEPDYNIKDGGVSLRIQNLSFFLFLLLGQLTLLLR